MTHLKYIFSLVVCGLMLLLSSCTHDDNEPGVSGTPAALTLNLSVDALDTETATRVTVPELAGESQVNNLFLFFFKPTSDGSGTLVGYVDMTSTLSGGSSNLPITTVGTEISTSEAYNVIGVANGNSCLALNWHATWVGRTEAEFRSQLLSEPLTADIERTDLPMYGATAKSAGNGNIALNLRRIVARFDVSISLTGHSITGVQLANVYTTASFSGSNTMDYSKDHPRNGGLFGTSANGGIGTTSIQGLYAYENQVTAPIYGDAVTTCLIVGVEHGGSTSYHRINIHPLGAAQIIKRNCVYSVNITDIISEGHAAADEAYNNASDDLVYTINNWDLGDNGVVISDSYSILAIPVKTVLFGSSGGSYTYTITTFSTLNNPTPLAMPSHDNGGGQFNVSLTGNQLTVTANTLAGGSDDITGSITLTYAGLKAEIEIVQSEKVENFLELSYETGFSSLLSAGTGDVSKKIFVNASGEWTAEIVGDGGLAFNDGSKSTIFTSGTSGSFELITISNNPSDDTTRKQFVIVSLNNDPINYVAVVSMQQAAAGNISISPLVNRVVFDGGGTIISPSGLVNNELSFTSATGNIDNITITGVNSDKFKYVVKNGTLTSTPAVTIEIATEGTNGTVGNYTATLVVVDTEGAKHEVNLVQNPLSISVKTTAPTTVEAIGGKTGGVILDINDGNATWTATVTTTGLEGTIYNHGALLETETGMPGTTLTGLDASTPFRVVFPKIYFPNREITVRATVTFTTNEGATVSHTFTQSKLASKGVHIWSSYNNRWGAISYNGAGNSNGAYFDPFNNYLKTHVLSAGGISKGNSSVTNASSGSSANTVAVSGSKTSWAHVSNNSITSGQNWDAVRNFMNTVDGVTVFMCDDYGTASLNSLRNNSPLNDLGYRFISGASASESAGNNTNLITASTTTNSRVYKFIVNNGKKAVSANLILYNDGVNTGVLTSSSLPATAIPILQYRGNGTYAMIIDPGNGTVYHGDCTNFNYSVNTSNSREQFMSNYQEYLAYAAMYGSHFTDMLIDTSSVPAPWDSVWGANAWPN